VTPGHTIPRTNPKGLRLLLVEDEDHLAAGLELNFGLDGYAVDRVANGRDAGRKLLDPDPYDVIVLDVMLPDVDGFTLCQRIRDGGNRTPILMLTARNAVEDRVAGLEVGADDYLTKPFELAELLARVRSLVRRRSWELEGDVRTSPSEYRFGDVSIDFDRAEARRGEEALHLTKLELDLLRYFAEHPGRVLSREELQKNVWKLSDYPNRRMVDNFILRLRRHFERDPSEPRYFVSVRGSGYKFVPDEA
jgi:DNA-binding response OmpR family regulator